MRGIHISEDQQDLGHTGPGAALVAKLVAALSIAACTGLAIFLVNLAVPGII